MKKHKRRFTSFRKIVLFITVPIIPCIILLFTFLAWYQSRAIPDVGSEVQMTSVPLSIAHVLGATSARPTGSFRVPVFLYHYVEYVYNDPGRQALNIPPNILTAQIETLKNAGYAFLTMDDLTNAIDRNRKLPQKSVILTFDDGYMDFYTQVLPILKKEQVRAVFYIVTDFLDRPNYLFTSQLVELAHSPYAEIGSHTLNHVALAGMNAKLAQDEILQSRKILQNLLHLPIHSFAYPYGSFDQQAIQMAKNAGYTNALSTVPGIIQSGEDEYYINRLRPGYRTGKELLSFLQQSSFQPW